MYRIGILCLIALFALSAQADVTVTATGVGASFTQARNDALRNAVEQGVGVKIFSESVVQDFVAIKDAIVSESFGLVTSYKVISKGKKSGLYEVKVEATVSNQVKENWAKIRIIMEQKGNPSIMFCLNETLDGMETPISTGENRLLDIFKSKLKFQVIDRQQHASLKELHKQIKSMEGDHNAVIAAASDLGAHLVVLGKLEGMFKGFQDFYGIQYVEHNYVFTVKVVRADTAEVVAAFTQTYYNRLNGMQYNREAAARAGFAQVAGDKYVQPLIERLVSTWIHEMQNSGALVNLVVSDVKFSVRNKIADALKESCEHIVSVDVDRYQSKRLYLRVMSKISTEELAGMLEEIAEVPMEIENVTKNTIEARYIGN